ncbi:magnesium transporter CorA family protein [Pseudomonadota bacterium]
MRLKCQKNLTYEFTHFNIKKNVYNVPEFEKATMYTIYKTSPTKLLNPKTPEKDSWIDFSSPSKKEISELQNITGLDDNDIEDLITSVKDREEAPKIEQTDNYQVILIQTPIDIKQDGISTFSVTPLAILYNNHHLITISFGKNDLIDYIKYKLRNYQTNHIIDTGNIQRIILKLLLFSSKIYIRYLKVIYLHIASAQTMMQKSPQDKEILKLLEVSKSLTYFNRSLTANHLVIEKLSKRKKFNSAEVDLELIEDALDENRQAMDTVKIYDRIVINTTNTFSNLISNNVNKTVKFLTAITLILTIPALVANVYGMNVPLPLQENANAFGYIIAIAGTLSLIGIIWFYGKKLF